MGSRPVGTPKLLLVLRLSLRDGAGSGMVFPWECCGWMAGRWGVNPDFGG